MAFKPLDPKVVFAGNTIPQNAPINVFTINREITCNERSGVFIRVEKRTQRSFDDCYTPYSYVDCYYLIYKTSNNNVVEELLGVNFGEGYRGFSLR